MGRIQVAVAHDCPPGRHEAIVSIYTEDPRYRHLEVPVTVVKRATATVSAKPDSLIVRNAGQPIPSRLLRIAAADRQGVIVDRVTTNHPALTCTWAPGPETDATVKVQVNQTKLAGSQRESQIHIHIRSPQPQVLTVPVSILHAE